MAGVTAVKHLLSVRRQSGGSGSAQKPFSSFGQFLCGVRKWMLKIRPPGPGGVWFAGEPRGRAAGRRGARLRGAGARQDPATASCFPPEETRAAGGSAGPGAGKETVIVPPPRVQRWLLLLLSHLGQCRR